MRGAKEIAFTVVSMSLSLVAVFIPILLMGGMVGRLFREFAVTLSVAILISLVVSLTTTPMMCARFLKPETAGSHGWLYRASERAFEWMLSGYEAQPRRGRSAITAPMLALTLDHDRAQCLSVIIVPKGSFLSRIRAG